MTRISTPTAVAEPTEANKGDHDMSKYPSWWWARRAAIAVAGTAILAATVAAPTPAAAGDRVDVIVRALPGSVDDAIASLPELGGRLGDELPIINGFSADVPEASLDELRAIDGVIEVTPDVTVRPTARNQAPAATTDTGTMRSVAQIVGADQLWAAGITGKGVGVALIDTGITRVPGLDRDGVFDGPDLSFDSQDPNLVHQDAYGHGTHMAGIIAGRDTGADLTDPDAFIGIAPEANLVSVKVGASDGAADVSQVIAAINWVVEHRDDAGLNIGVINLSFGTDATQDHAVDPLSFAAEQAWRQGIVVVVSAGNDGLSVPTLSNPAYNPVVLAVGGDDPHGTIDRRDDTVPDFATHGTESRPVDVIAPAVSIQSLAVPGSYIDETHPEGKVGDRLMRGSGTSQAAAVTSGVVALLLQKFPDASPDAIKSLLSTSAFPLPGENALYRGHGVVDAAAAASRRSAPSAVQVGQPAEGTGSLELARGSAHVADRGVELTGEIDIFGNAWDGSRWSMATAAGSTWSDGVWNGSRWTGGSWTGSRWSAAVWDSALWSGSRWTSAFWDGSRWTDAVWDGSRWTGTSWDGSRWTSMVWDGSRWSGSRWTSSNWDGSRWTGSRWTGSRWTGSRWSSAGWE